MARCQAMMVSPMVKGARVLHLDHVGLPAMPADMTQERLDVVVPIEFALR